ncbi:hypothetical protein DXG01_013193 [Tephrocybe rancida]|nr:hypothetical protein DXG01_013193 [Tephrocybe rancida]
MGLSWDTPANEVDLGQGANITTQEEKVAWDAIIGTKQNHPLKPYSNKGWLYLKMMEELLPIAGASGGHSFAPGTDELHASPLVDNSFEEPGGDLMAVDLPNTTTESQPSSAISTPSTSIPIVASATLTTVSPTATLVPAAQPAPKQCCKEGDVGSDGSNTMPPPSASSLSAASSEKRKRHASKEKATFQSSTHSTSTSSSSISTARRVEKLTPAAAIVSLEGSVNEFTAVIKEASQHTKSAEEKAAERCEKMPDLVLQRGEEDGLDTRQQARLITYLLTHNNAANYYFGMKQPGPLRLAVCMEWLVLMPTPVPVIILARVLNKEVFFITVIVKHLNSAIHCLRDIYIMRLV